MDNLPNRNEAYQKHHTDTGGNVIVPDDASALPEQTKPATEKKSRKGLITLGAFGAGVAIAAGTILGISNGDKGENNAPPEKNPDETSVVEAIPDAEPIENPLAESLKDPEPVETTAPVEVKEVSAVERLSQLSVEEFESLERDERLILVADMLQKSKSTPQYYGPGDGLFRFNPADIASIDNDGNEIIQQYWYLNQLSLNQVPTGKERTNDAPLDKSMATKSLSGAYYYIKSDDVYSRIYDTYVQYIDTEDTRTMINDRYTAAETGELKQGHDKDGKPITYRIINYFTSAGNGYKAKFAYEEFTNDKGARKGIWQLVDQVGSSDPLE